MTHCCCCAASARGRRAAAPRRRRALCRRRNDATLRAGGDRHPFAHAAPSADLRFVNPASDMIAFRCFFSCFSVVNSTGASVARSSSSRNSAPATARRRRSAACASSSSAPSGRAPSSIRRAISDGVIVGRCRRRIQLRLAALLGIPQLRLRLRDLLEKQRLGVAAAAAAVDEGDEAAAQLVDVVAHAGLERDAALVAVELEAAPREQRARAASRVLCSRSSSARGCCENCTGDDVVCVRTLLLAGPVCVATAGTDTIVAAADAPSRDLSAAYARECSSSASPSSTVDLIARCERTSCASRSATLRPRLPPPAARTLALRRSATLFMATRRSASLLAAAAIRSSNCLMPVEPRASCGAQRRPMAWRPVTATLCAMATVTATVARSDQQHLSTRAGRAAVKNEV